SQGIDKQSGTAKDHLGSWCHVHNIRTSFSCYLVSSPRKSGRLAISDQGLSIWSPRIWVRCIASGLRQKLFVKTCSSRLRLCVLYVPYVLCGSSQTLQ